jgi:hypothetical protein
MHLYHSRGDFLFLLLIIFFFLCGYSHPSFSHPTPIDDLMRPKVQLLSRNPIRAVVTIQPRENLSSATIETPNNSEGEIVQCEFGVLVANQIYQCSVVGRANSNEAAFSINVNGVIVEQDGQRHFSSRGFSITNPTFDLDAFRAERRQEALKRRSAGRPEKVLNKD